MPIKWPRIVFWLSITHNPLKGKVVFLPMGGIFYYTGCVYNYTRAEYNKLKSEEEIELFRKNTRKKIHLDNAKEYNNEFRKQGGEKKHL